MTNKKVDRFQIRRSISGGTVISLTDFFYVPKEEDDIRLVCDLTASGMNDKLRAPTFWMPSVDNFLDVAIHLS